MKLFLRTVFATIALTLFFSAFGVTETRAQNILPEILKRMEAHRKTLTSLRTNVKMDKYNPQIDSHDTTEGTAVYLPAPDAVCKLHIFY